MPKTHQKEEIMEEAIVSKQKRKKEGYGLFWLFSGGGAFLFLNVHTAYAAEGLKLSTDYPEYPLSPGITNIGHTG